MEKLKTLLDLSAQRHDHLCPRQVLGVRLGMYAGCVLGLELPQIDKRLFTFAESDGCGTGGISVATGCWVDRRTLRIMDFGKMAATFVDIKTNQAIRIAPHPHCRKTAERYAPNAIDHWHCQLDAYQVMPDDELFVYQYVFLNVDLKKIISKPGLRVMCECCGEEISNEREVHRNGKVLCRYCAGERYFSPGFGASVNKSIDSLDIKDYHLIEQ